MHSTAKGGKPVPAGPQQQHSSLHQELAQDVCDAKAQLADLFQLFAQERERQKAFRHGLLTRMQARTPTQDTQCAS